MTAIDTVSHDDAHLWRARLDEGLTPDERREFDEWLDARPEHRLALAQSEVTWGALGRIEFGELASASPEADVSEYPDSVLANDNTPTKGWALLAASLAACLVAGVTLGWGWTQSIAPPEPPERQLFASADGASTIIELPDRSRIRLAPNSRLDFAILQDRRDIRLIEGSARFTVAKQPNKPFLVRSDIAQVRVTGTQFDAALMEDQFEVRVIEGSVDVLPRGAGLTEIAEIQLVAGDAITTSDGLEAARLSAYVAGAAIASTVQSDKTTERLEYIGAPLAQVVDDINRLGGGPLAVDPMVESLRLSGTFELGELGAISEVIDAALPVAIEERDGVRTIVPE